MFDSVQIARRIREARLGKNMTQMELADNMGVSYQAVSNWERANSMPDIGKLGQLCMILEISIDDLLGNDRAVENLKQIMNRREDEPVQAMPIEEVAEVLPLLPPKEAQEYVDSSVRTEEKANLKAIRPLAPFLEGEYLEKLIDRAENVSLKELSALAPFLEPEYLDRTAEKAILEGVKIKEVLAIAPFMSKDGLGRVAEKAEVSSLRELQCLAPFLRSEMLGKLVERAGTTDFREVSSLAPFLSGETLDQLVSRALQSEEGLEHISSVLPFLKRETVQRLAEELMKRGNTRVMKSVMPFL